MQKPLAGLTAKNAGKEFIAGITLIAIAVPLNIGYAQIAGLPATAGLYALVVPTLLYALIVSSRQVVASPDAAAAALVASSLGGLAVAGSQSYMTLALAQAILCGIFLIAMAWFKLGFLANFLSKPILVGFVGGLALDILASQTAKMLGIHLEPGSEFVEKVSTIIADFGTLNVWSLLIAAVSVVVLMLGKKFAGAVPWALIVLVAATIATVATHADQAGVDILGDVPAGPPVLTWPVIPWIDWLLLIPSALALTLVTTAEGLLVSRSYGEKRGYTTVPNRDLLAFGVSNIAAGASGSFSVGSSTSRTAAMDQAGSRTQLPSIVLAAGTLLLLMFGTALLKDIPSPAIGAIVGVAVLPLLGIAEFKQLWKLDRFEFAVGAACFLVTLLIGSIAGILVAFVLALINMAKRASNPAIDVLGATSDPNESLLYGVAEGTATAPGIVVVRPAAPLFFANGNVFNEYVKSAIEKIESNQSQDNPPVRHLVIDFEAVNDADVTAAESFESLDDWLEHRNISLYFSRVRDELVPRLKHLGILEDEKLFPTNREALLALTSLQTHDASNGSEVKDGK
ncbi:SulP family inorganic anion transporter [Glutamicibacter sp.]|uniref:SulP family inorganic anion transporter n=1 Tax=Glutamicibacter sp. TaxID=1931995 RepID=UPI0028BD813D|nr:SulP family inorganic anion transporter [Glutamicibacter sp.]